jgi:hypothetical protein
MGMWQILAAVVVATTLGACGPAEGEVTSSQLDRMRAAVEDLPPAYSFDVSSTCGERNLLGDFRVTVVAGDVDRVQPLGGSRLLGLQPDDFPTLADLVELVDGVGSDAVVEVRLDDEDLPLEVAIDHVPDAIDDEECYRVSNVT